MEFGDTADWKYWKSAPQGCAPRALADARKIISGKFHVGGYDPFEDRRLSFDFQ